MAWLKLCGVRLIVRKKKVSLLAGVLLVTSFSMMFVFFKTSQLDSQSPGQLEAHDPGMHRNLKKVEELKRITKVQEVTELYKHKVSDGKFDQPVVASSPSLSRGGVRRTSEGTDKMCRDWVSRAPKAPYFLTVVMNVRIYEKDKANLTSKELLAWILYLRYIGVEHVYLYDVWLYQNESQLSTLQMFLDEGYITYTDWHTHNPYKTKTTTIAAYQDCIDRQKNETKWQVAIDVDEYPFSPMDTAPGFLYRFVERFSERNPQASEICMQNYLYLGKPLDKELLIERLLRRTPKPFNNLVKPIYQPSNVHANIHHNRLITGKTMKAPVQELRMNHYWGARLQDWGEDTPEILGKTEPDYSIQPIVDAFKNCEVYVRPYLG